MQDLFDLVSNHMLVIRPWLKYDNDIKYWNKEIMQILTKAPFQNGSWL